MAMALAMKKLGKTKQEISDMCPREFYLNYLNWLLGLTGAIAVWSEFVSGPEFTKAQVAMLRKLKMAGVYTGAVPKISSKNL